MVGSDRALPNAEKMTEDKAITEGRRGPSRLLDDSAVGLVAKEKWWWWWGGCRQKCTCRGQTKGNVYNDRDDGEVQPSRWENKNQGRRGWWKADVIGGVSNGA